MWDVVVVGGGPAGSGCAAALARQSWRVLVADASLTSRPALADTVGPEVGRRLTRLLPVGDLSAGIVVKSRGVLSLWDTAAPAVTDYELECGAPALTLHRPVLDDLLLERAAAAGAVVRRGWRAVRLEAGQGTAAAAVEFATVSGVRREEARLVIVATGRAGIAGLPRRTYLDRQLAFAAVVVVGETHDLLWVERVDDGWWYLTRVSDSTAQVVFVSEAGVRPRRGPVDQWFVHALARTRLIRTACSSPPPIARVVTYDARASAPAVPCPPRVLLAGDASGTADPLSGLGWKRAFQSADEIAARADDFLRGSRPLDALAHHRNHVAWLHAHVAQRQAML